MVEFTPELIVAIIAAIAAIAAWISTILTKRSVKAMEESVKVSKNALFADIILRIRESYGSDNIFESMMMLKKFKKEQGEDFAKIYGKILKENFEGIKDIHKNRRRISHHFFMIEDMLKHEIIDEEFIKKSIGKWELDFYFNIVYPMEKNIPKYPGDYCKNLKRIFESM